MKNKLFLLLFGFIFVSKFAVGVAGPPPCDADPSCCGGSGFSNNGGTTCYTDGTCTTSCGSGCEAWPACDESCSGSGYSDDNGTTCYTTSACDTQCSGAPEMPLLMRGLIPLFVIAGTVFLIKRRKKKKK